MTLRDLAGSPTTQFPEHATRTAGSTESLLQIGHVAALAEHFQRLFGDNYSFP